ncbi:MAG TPA: M3 family oligoendopeptidase [Candidatus Baltobacteraceae bacterium]|nr:M3 family oligoendopeptidase [Candidatus Baltobacteraceae bacterium]
MLTAPPTFKPADRFTDITASPPELQRTQAFYDDLVARLERAQSFDDALEVFAAWDAQRREFITWSALAELHFEQDTSNPQYKAESDLLNELRPKITGLEVALKRKFLGSPLRSQLEAQLGDYLFARWETEVTAYDPVVERFAVQEANLQDEYTELLAQAIFDFRGERCNLPQIAKFSEDPDREVRREAAIMRWEFFSANREKLDRIYDALVHVRTQTARELDYHNFIELGYRRLTRTDYGPAEVARYREEIVREIVPLAQRIAQQQARDLGVDELLVWDEHVFAKDGAPKPPQDYDRMLAAGSEVFRALGPEIGGFAQLMIDRELLDLRSRDRKAGGGFCTSFPTYGLPYIFANFNGTTHDVNVLVHEMGHAFQNYSSRALAVSDYLWPTFEACEVHSMSMEFFTWPQLERFFGDDAQRYRLQHLKTSILFLPYGAAVDHFQHFVYERPDASADERHAFWKQLEATYMPWRRYGGIEHLEQGGYWQMQRHIYQMPFYYIDYTLALCCALQFWAKSLDDYDRALTDYRALCARGGKLPFQSLVRSAGLRSPFESGVLHGVAQRAASIMGLD